MEGFRILYQELAPTSVTDAELLQCSKLRCYRLHTIGAQKKRTHKPLPFLRIVNPSHILVHLLYAPVCSCKSLVDSPPPECPHLHWHKRRHHPGTSRMPVWPTPNGQWMASAWHWKPVMIHTAPEGGTVATLPTLKMQCSRARPLGPGLRMWRGERRRSGGCSGAQGHGSWDRHAEGLLDRDIYRMPLLSAPSPMPALSPRLTATRGLTAPSLNIEGTRARGAQGGIYPGAGPRGRGSRTGKEGPGARSTSSTLPPLLRGGDPRPAPHSALPWSQRGGWAVGAEQRSAAECRGGV